MPHAPLNQIAVVLVVSFFFSAESRVLKKCLINSSFFVPFESILYYSFTLYGFSDIVSVIWNTCVHIFIYFWCTHANIVKVILRYLNIEWIIINVTIFLLYKQWHFNHLLEENTSIKECYYTLDTIFWKLFDYFSQHVWISFHNTIFLDTNTKAN